MRPRSARRGSRGRRSRRARARVGAGDLRGRPRIRGRPAASPPPSGAGPAAAVRSRSLAAAVRSGSLAAVVGRVGEAIRGAGIERRRRSRVRPACLRIAPHRSRGDRAPLIRRARGVRRSAPPRPTSLRNVPTAPLASSASGISRSSRPGRERREQDQHGAGHHRADAPVVGAGADRGAAERQHRDDRELRQDQRHQQLDRADRPDPPRRPHHRGERERQHQHDHVHGCLAHQQLDPQRERGADHEQADEEREERRVGGACPGRRSPAPALARKCALALPAAEEMNPHI